MTLVRHSILISPGFVCAWQDWSLWHKSPVHAAPIEHSDSYMSANSRSGSDLCQIQRWTEEEVFALPFMSHRCVSEQTFDTPPYQIQ